MILRTTWKYHRVSTDEQDTDNQAQSVSKWCAENNHCNTNEFAEHASTKLHWRDRGINDIIIGAKPGDFIVCSEISRLARTTLECLEIFKACAESQITIVAVKNGLVMDGSMSAKIVSTVLAMAAEIERDMIRARTTEALARRKAKGLPMGRPHGAKSESKLNGKRADIERLMAAKVSKKAIARLMICSRNTLERALEKWEETA